VSGIKINRALVSVSNKEGLVGLGQRLQKLGIGIISTGNTHKKLVEAGVDAEYISDVTGFPEILGGRVKTLHPRIHAGLLADRGVSDHMQELKKLEIEPIDLVICNLYPFAETIRGGDVDIETAVENIDIGGPTMIRAAAKNHSGVVVVVSPEDYAKVLDELEANGCVVSLQTSRKLAAKAFAHTAAYDALIADYFAHQVEENADGFPQEMNLTFAKVSELRYGENPHQKAAFYQQIESREQGMSLTSAEQLHGKPLSFNNINDAGAALEMVKEFTEPTVVAVKHTNPCGIGSGRDLLVAYDKAYESDPVSIFGGIIGVNRTLTEDIARKINELFIEIVIAPEFTPGALAVLRQKEGIRLLRIPGLSEANGIEPGLDMKRVRGGVLVQDLDRQVLEQSALKVVTGVQPDDETMSELKFAWKVVKHVKSNAIVLSKNHGTIGIGAGQMNRVLAAEIAVNWAKEKAAGAVLASDAFFPFPDVVELAARAGVRAIIQPGGSIRDQESIDAANDAGITMVFTGMRHFKH